MPVVLKAVDAHELPPSGSLLQTPLWARLKSEFGWQAHCFRLEMDGLAAPLLLLTRSVGAGVTIGYLPHPLSDIAPVLGRAQAAGAAGNTASRIAELLSALAERLDCRPTLLRADLAQEAELLPADELRRAGLRRAPVDVQPPSTVIVDLSRDEAALLASMKSKTRYNIRLGERKGVVVRQVGPKRLGQWYELYRETARRDRIVLHSFDYYRRLFELAQDDPQVDLRLLFAEHQRDLLAGIVVATVGRTATYLYGASSTQKRNLMASHVIQWHAMQLSREAGCVAYDLFGIPPAVDPGHPMAGLYRFKTGFGGRIVHRAGCHDLPLRPLRYRAYTTAERLRNLYYKRLRRL